MLTESIFKAIASGLSLWESKDARKYMDRLIQIKEDYHEEYNREFPDHNKLVNLEYKLQHLCQGFASQVGAEKTVA